MTNYYMALLLTAIAGFSTGIGSAIAYFIRRPKAKYLAFALGLSAGVMIYVSFIELLPTGLEALGDPIGVLIFFGGMGIVACLDAIFPEMENPHHPVLNGCGESSNMDTNASDENGEKSSEEEVPVDGHLKKVGIMTAVAIAVHNFPEGMATFGTALGDLQLGLMIMIAIAIHNIPEGISVSIPIYYATKDRKKAFLYSFLSGVSEPIGAAVAALILMPYLNEAVIGGMLAFISGIMVYVSMDEILPTAHHYGTGHSVIVGVVLGMAIMAASLLLL